MHKGKGIIDSAVAKLPIENCDPHGGTLKERALDRLHTRKILSVRFLEWPDSGDP